MPSAWISLSNIGNGIRISNQLLIIAARRRNRDAAFIAEFPKRFGRHAFWNAAFEFGNAEQLNRIQSADDICWEMLAKSIGLNAKRCGKKRLLRLQMQGNTEG